MTSEMFLKLWFQGDVTNHFGALKIFCGTALCKMIITPETCGKRHHSELAWWIFKINYFYLSHSPKPWSEVRIFKITENWPINSQMPINILRISFSILWRQTDELTSRRVCNGYRERWLHLLQSIMAHNACKEPDNITSHCKLVLLLLVLSFKCLLKITHRLYK